jgi:hypothetical protein
MPDEAAIIESFADAVMSGDATLLNLLGQGADAITAYAAEQGEDRKHIVYEAVNVISERIINRGQSRFQVKGFLDIHVWGPGGSTFNDITGVVDRVDELFENASGPFSGGTIEECWRENIFPLPEIENGIFYPRRTLRFHVVAQAN